MGIMAQPIAITIAIMVLGILPFTHHGCSQVCAIHIAGCLEMAQLVAELADLLFQTHQIFHEILGFLG